jgi:modulator of FtsH protease HflK
VGKNLTLRTGGAWDEHLETMERVLGGIDKTIIDTGGQSSPGVVPYLPLNSPPRERPTQESQSGGNQ